MRLPRARWWLLLLPLLYGSLFAGCGQILKQSFYQGTLQLITGEFSERFVDPEVLTSYFFDLLTREPLTGMKL